MNVKIFSLAEKYLALRMHSVSELRDKLRKKFPDEKEEAEKVIQYFLGTKALNDYEYAKMFLQYRQMQKPKSEYLLRKELQNKGVEKEIIEVVLSENPLDDVVNACELASRKLHTISRDLESQKKKEKVFRYLESRGFSYGVIKKAWEKIEKELE